MDKFEQETIINFNKAEKTGYIFTYEATWKKHLEQKLGLKPIYKNGHGGREYEIDKSRIRMPQAKRKYSKTQLKNLKTRLAEARQNTPQTRKTHRGM